MLVSNHKRLVNDCYPAEHSPQPDSNSLSRLTYYCSTRPHKLNKVTAYLLAFARVQALPQSLSASLSPHRHSKPGLLCTIQLFQAILHTCQPHLPLFLHDLLSFIAIALGLGLDHPDPGPPGIIGQGWVGRDPDIALRAVELFISTVNAMGPTSLLDEELARAHLFLLAKFSSIAMVTPSAASLSQPLNFARTLTVIALGETVRSTGLYSSSQYNKQIKLLVPGLLAAILPNASDRPAGVMLQTISDLGLDPSVSPENDLSPEELTTTFNTLGTKLLNNLRRPTIISPETDLIKYSLTALNYLLATPAAAHAQYNATISAVLAHANPLPPTWLAQVLACWSVPKYRPLLVDALLPHPSLLAPLLEYKQLGPLNVLKTLKSLVNHIIASTEPIEPLIAAIGALASRPYYDFQSRDIVAHLLQHATKATKPDPILRALQLVINQEPSPEVLLDAFADALPSFHPSPELERVLRIYVNKIGPIEYRSRPLARFIISLSTQDSWLELVVNKRWLELLLAFQPSKNSWNKIAINWSLDPTIDRLESISSSELIQSLTKLNSTELKKLLTNSNSLITTVRRHSSVPTVRHTRYTLQSPSISELKDSIKTSTTTHSTASIKRKKRNKLHTQELLDELKLIVGSSAPRLVVVPPYGP
ncbi:hypothetical protein CROQUDRAFT_664639 [Cronartium quercuum f. sp. fusiforme G11]|uniref:Uncharacterized protein n=1 Tax=Cronartium quercuum f. sp. fusiforme G11 TaxID=708437 RepID=A0A9P6T6B6_9BASI|nr:hypothetical protein CROQUDRAFT_664639 [Cronartium quercuum f. sp. fusiforme G11]